MSELDYIIKAAGQFYKEAGIEFPDDVHDYYQDLLDNPMVFAEVNIGKGFIVGFIAPSTLNPNKLQAQEIAWYVEPEYRGTTVAIRLIKAYETEAIKRGCKQIGMVCLEAIDPNTTGDIYNRLGYNKYETHYLKEVK